MTVGELIKRLSQIEENTLVTHVNGENGRTDVTNVTLEPDYYHPELEVVVIS